MIGPISIARNLDMGRFVALQSPDGHAFDAYLAEPEGVPRGGLVVGMEMYGINSYLTGVCDTYAKKAISSSRRPCLIGWKPARFYLTTTPAIAAARSFQPSSIMN